MNPNVPPPDTTQHIHPPVAPGYPPHPGIPNPATLPMSHEEESEDVADRQRRNSKLVSIGVAVLAHVVIILICILVVVTKFTNKVPTIEVTGDGNNPELLEKKQFQQRVTRRPSAASSNPIKTIVSNATDAIAVPVVDKVVDDPLDFGVAGIGDGLGFGGAGMGMGGGSFLGLSGGGKNIVLVIDTSSSMPGNCKPEGIAAIRSEIKKTITALSPSTKFNIVCYANDADIFKKESVPANSNNKQAALKFMEGYFGAGPWRRTRNEALNPKESWKVAKDRGGVEYIPVDPGSIEGLDGTSGSSRIEFGAMAAFELNPSTIFILSDGDPNTTIKGKAANHKDLIKLMRKSYNEHFKDGKSVSFGTVSINGKGEKFLKDVAREFKGKHKDIRPDKL